MNTLKEVPHLGAIDHAIEVLRASFDHPEADEAIAGLKLLREQAAWAHHTPALLSDADAAADLAGVERPGAEPFGHVTVKRVQHHADRYEFFPAGQTPYLDNVDECHAVYTTPPQASQQDAVDADMPLDKDALAQLIAPMLYGTYHCTRVWNAWNVGTMSQDDFEPVDESDTPYEIADAIRAAIAAHKGKP